jgi:hypothetical protein
VSVVIVFSVRRSSLWPGDRCAAPWASITLPSAEQCSGTDRPTQFVAPIRYVLSTWAICSTMPLLVTARLIVSPVALPSFSRNGWATATRPASAPPRQAKLTNISPGRNLP